MSRSFLAAFFWLAAAVPAAAHHSSAMFDTTRLVEVTGKVRVFQWTNPHCWIQLLVDDGAAQKEWSVELGSPSQLYNVGWRPKSVAAGESVTIGLHPLRDGSAGGLFVNGHHADGKALGALQ